MKALIINPYFYDFKGYDEWMQPIGLLQIASILKNERWNISFINCLERKRETDKIFGLGKYPFIEIEKPPIFKNIPRKYKKYGIEQTNFTAQIKKCGAPDVILITSAMTYWYQGVFDIIKTVRNYFKNVPVILGGIYATVCYNHALQNSKADFVFKGSDINALLKLLEDITGKKTLDRYDSFSEYPPPFYRLLGETASIPVLTSLGCPFKCSYCASSILYPTISKTDGKKLAEKISEEIKNMNITDIAFYDDALLIDYENTCGVFTEFLRKYFPNMRFHTPNALHAKYINKQVALHMKKNGFKTIKLGFEFANEEMQRKSGGKVSTENIESAVENLFSAGFHSKEISLYIMCGAPECNAAEIEQAIEKSKNLKVRSQLVEYSPIPGTKMWESFPNTDTPEALDPLFHNNTYQIYKSAVIPLEDYNRLKNLSKIYNSMI